MPEVTTSSTSFSASSRALQAFGDAFASRDAGVPPALDDDDLGAEHEEHLRDASTHAAATDDPDRTQPHQIRPTKSRESFWW